MKKIMYALVAIFVFAITLSFSSRISAKNEDEYVLPETEGVYDVPGRPDLKLKVFVYHTKDDFTDKAAKPGKPGPSAPVLACSATSVADPDSASVVKSAGWKLPSTWTYRINLSSVPATVGSSNAEKLISNGYSTWANILGGKIAFGRGTDTAVNRASRDGQNIVTWGRTSGTALAVTYTWYDLTGLAVEIDTIMNNKFSWYWSDPVTWAAGQTCAYQGVYDAQNILTHELGHTVGLDDEYDPALFANNTMYGYGSKGETKKNTLTSGDIFGAQLNY